MDSILHGHLAKCGNNIFTTNRPVYKSQVVRFFFTPQSPEKVRPHPSNYYGCLKMQPHYSQSSRKTRPHQPATHPH